MLYFLIQDNIGRQKLVQITKFTNTRIYGIDVVTGDTYCTTRNLNCLKVSINDVKKYKRNKLNEIAEIDFFKKQREEKEKMDTINKQKLLEEECICDKELFGEDDEELFEELFKD